LEPHACSPPCAFPFARFFAPESFGSSAHRMLRKSGPGLGGPYLLPNMHALVYLCEHFNLHDQAIYWRAVIEMDGYQRRRLIEVVMSHIHSFKGIFIVIIIIIIVLIIIIIIIIVIIVIIIIIIVIIIIIIIAIIHSFKGKRAAVLGFAYKAFTSDSRGSPSVDIVRSLLQEGASVYIYDPRVAAEDVMNAFGYHRDVHVAGDEC